ncbi:MAG: DEAD/DEAH box helicase [Thermofilaceae archaeon]|nr:DEAD/DEAH box helicase [Thermofilaceae archaeon]MCX8181286.1 DEAD/DEAH box helicase [Thermofilaceae archaeon]MDW8004629.1 DEAD/DEAH box helicase [Thermofilaceae archaeon]
MNASELLNSKLLEVSLKYGYVSFNELQLRAFATLKRRVNTVIIAPTGYGKTEAVLFPIMSSLVTMDIGDQRVKALYITPLRALNRDIFHRMNKIALELGLRLGVRHGDTPQSARRKMIENPPQILITTPETLQFILVNKKMREALQDLEWVVVDELHELISSKRGAQLTISLERLESLCRLELCRVGLSATLRDPIQAGFFLTGGRYFEVVEAEGVRRYEVSVVYVSSYDDVEERVKFLADLLDQYGSVIVFTNTRETAEALGARLRKLRSGVIEVHHGSLSKEQRVEVERRLKEGLLRCVIATSSLELGIDVGHVGYVVQYMSPRQVNRLVQRIGRSSHFIGGVAKGCIIAADPDDLLESIVISKRAAHGDLENIGFEEKAYDVLAHQLVGLLLERGEVSIEEAHKLVSRAWPYRNISIRELKTLAEFLNSIKILRLKNEKLSLGSRSIRYYYEAASTIPDVETLDVIDVADRRKIGVLDGDFAISSLAEGSRFILGGKAWEVVKLALDEGRVYVNAAGEFEAAIPAWMGEDLPVPYKVAREVGALRRRLLSEPLSKLSKEYGVDERVLSEVRGYLESQKQVTGMIPSDRDIIIECGNKLVVIHACLGTRANSLLALLLSFMLAKGRGISSKQYFDAYRVAFSLSRDISPEDIRELLINKFDELISLVREAIKTSGLYLWKLKHVCQRMGILEKGSEPKLPIKKLAELLEGSAVEEEVIRELLNTRLDLETLRLLSNNLKEKRVQIHAVRVKEFSPMAKILFEKPYRVGILVRGTEPLLVLDALKKRLVNTRMPLVCLHCLEWSNEILVGEAPEQLLCPKCGSKAIAVLNYWGNDALKVLKKWRKGGKLSKEETDIVKNAQKSAILLMSYGRKALLCLAGRGIGPTVASKILSASKSEEELVRDIAKAEVNYLRTREYWDR